MVETTWLCPVHSGAWLARRRRRSRILLRWPLTKPRTVAGPRAALARASRRCDAGSKLRDKDRVCPEWLRSEMLRAIRRYGGRFSSGPALGQRSVNNQ